MRIQATLQCAVLAFFLAAILGGNSGSAGDADNPALSAALRAFEAEPDFNRELADFESQGYVRGPFQTISLGGFCGVAGCDSSFLVAVTLSRGRDLPKRILANVTVRAPGFTVVSIRRMQLVPVVPINRTPESRGD